MPPSKEVMGYDQKYEPSINACISPDQLNVAPKGYKIKIIIFQDQDYHCHCTKCVNNCTVIYMFMSKYLMSRRFSDISNVHMTQRLISHNVIFRVALRSQSNKNMKLVTLAICMSNRVPSIMEFFSKRHDSVKYLLSIINTIDCIAEAVTSKK